MSENKGSSRDSSDLVGGWLCLDFVNTLSWRGRKNPTERLNNYKNLVSWSQRVGILTSKKANQFIQTANRHPSEAEGVFKRGIQLREAIYHMFSAKTSNLASKSHDLETLNVELSKAMAKTQITQISGRYALTFGLNENSLDFMLWPIARSAADLLTSDKLERVRKCAAVECGWLFLDMSRNRSRRWCDMRDCGNRAKARRHYLRRCAVTK